MVFKFPIIKLVGIPDRICDTFFCLKSDAFCSLNCYYANSSEITHSVSQCETSRKFHFSLHVTCQMGTKKQKKESSLPKKMVSKIVWDFNRHFKHYKN